MACRSIRCRRRRSSSCAGPPRCATAVRRSAASSTRSTTRIPDALPDQPIHAEVTGTYGSGADTRQGAAHIEARAGEFALHADAFNRRADDYSIPGGTQSNSYVNGDGYALGGSYFFGADFLGLGAVNYTAKYGIPGEDTYIDMKQTKEMLRAAFGGGGDTLKRVTLDAGSADYEHSEIDPATADRLATFKDNEWDARVESTFNAAGPFAGIAVGAQFQNRDFSALGEGEDYLQPTTTKTQAVFGFAEVPLGDKVRLQTGVRVEDVDVTGTPASDVLTKRSFTPVSGALGALFTVNEHAKVGLTFTSAARAPAQTELFARGPHDGPATFETGDPTLDAERANSLEATLRLNHEHVGFEGALWQAHFDHYIYGALTGRTCDDDGVCVDDDSQELKELNYTQAGATFTGAEGKASFPLGSGSNGGLTPRPAGRLRPGDARSRRRQRAAHSAVPRGRGPALASVRVRCRVRRALLGRAGRAGDGRDADRCVHVPRCALRLAANAGAHGLRARGGGPQSHGYRAAQRRRVEQGRGHPAGPRHPRGGAIQF